MSKIEDLARERVKKLLNSAQEIHGDNPALADRYVDLAWKIKTKCNLRLGDSLKRKFCRKCRSVWIPGKTCRFRISSKRPPHLVITCEECGYIKRIPYKESK
ncbi:MAG: ribonuclease P protein component 4 [Candidatus Hadarchaeia archaeon]